VTDLDLLARVPLFADMQPDDLRHLADQLRSRPYRKGEMIFMAGDPGTSLYIIEHGRVKLSLNSAEGREVILDLLTSGDVFGELALLDGKPRSADAVTLEASRLLLLARDEFVRFLEERPRTALALLCTLSLRLRRDAALVQDAAFLDVPARLARVLLRVAEPDADGSLRTPPLTQTVLAGLAGTTRESLNQWLRFFERGGLIKSVRKRVTILSPDELRRRIN